jgi:hypothetical protein
LYGLLAHAPSQYFPCPAPATLAERALSLIFIGPNPNPNQTEGGQGIRKDLVLRSGANLRNRVLWICTTLYILLLRILAYKLLENAAATLKIKISVF